MDVSYVGCGIKGALYLVEMAEDGGMSQYPANKAGARYGTGYCDSQCAQDLQFINGEVCRAFGNFSLAHLMIRSWAKHI